MVLFTLKGTFVFIYVKLNILASTISAPSPARQSINQRMGEELHQIWTELNRNSPYLHFYKTAMTKMNQSETHVLNSLSCVRGDTEHVPDRSTCPWTTVVNHNSSRYPAFIPEAKARCNRCINQNNDNFICEPVELTIQVLILEANLTGSNILKVEHMMVAVGATCAVRRHINKCPNHQTCCSSNPSNRCMNHISNRSMCPWILRDSVNGLPAIPELTMPHGYCRGSNATYKDMFICEKIIGTIDIAERINCVSGICSAKYFVSREVAMGFTCALRRTHILR